MGRLEVCAKRDIPDREHHALAQILPCDLTSNHLASQYQPHRADLVPQWCHLSRFTTMKPPLASFETHKPAFPLPQCNKQSGFIAGTGGRKKEVLKGEVCRWSVVERWEEG